MFGTLRLVLAALVALNHVGFVIEARHPAVSSVVIFYILSGYVMTGLIRNHYVGSTRILSYYCDRALRIYPQYLFFCVIAVGLLIFFNIRSEFLSDEISIRNLAFNAAIIPLDFFMVNGIDRFTLLPPTWSLGAELQLYLLLPFILAWEVRPHTLAISVAIFALAAINHIDPDSFGYRLLPSILCMFLSGSLIYDSSNAKGPAVSHCYLGATYLIVLLCLLWDIRTGVVKIPYTLEVCLGYLLGVPAVLMLSRLGRNRLDDFMGNLSYGVFLSHFIVIWSAQRFHLFEPRTSYHLYLLACAVLAFIGFYFIERPLIGLRNSFRFQRAQHVSSASEGAATS